MSPLIWEILLHPRIGGTLLELERTPTRLLYQAEIMIGIMRREERKAAAGAAHDAAVRRFMP